MAMPLYNIYDTVNQTTPIPAGGTTPGGITALLRDRNFLSLLAGIGAGLDPKGVGGAIGVPTRELIAAQAAQAVGAKVAQQPRRTIRKYSDLLDTLGYPTPPGVAGPTSLRVKPDQSYVVEGTLDYSPQTSPDDLVQDNSFNQNTRLSLGQAPTQQEIDDLVDFPQATPASGARGVATRVAPQTLSAEDLKGLSAEQVDRVIARSLDASQLETQVLGLMGRDAASERQNRRLINEAERRARETAATALNAAKFKAAETIAGSNLTPQQQEALFHRLDAATTLEAARGELVNAAKLPPRVVSAQDRDDLSRQMFGGRSYGQLMPAEQASVNARVLQERANWTIQTTDSGIYRVNPRTGDTFQITGPTGAAASSAPGATTDEGAVGALADHYRQIGPDNAKKHRDVAVQTATPDVKALAQQAFEQAFPSGGTAPSGGAALVPYENLSPFAKSVSEPPKPPVFGAKPPTEGQAKALGYGSRALQSHEIITNLEKQDPSTATNYRLWVAQKLDELGEWSPFKTGAGVGGAVTARGAIAGALSGLQSAAGMVPGLQGLPTANVQYALTRQALQGALAGARAAGMTGLLVATAAGGLVTLSPVMAGLIRTEDEKQYLAAKLDFMSAILRKESGAAISVGEFVSEDKRYFPQLNEPASVIAQKERAREQAIASIQRESGRKLIPPNVVPTTPAQRFLGIPRATTEPTSEDITTGMVQQQEALRQQLGGPAPEPPKQVLPVSPQSQQRAAPQVPPRATIPTEHLVNFQVLKALGSQEIVKGTADPILREIDAELLNQQQSYFAPTQRAAIRSRLKKLGIQK